MATQAVPETQVISIDVSQQDYAALERAAEAEHTDVATYVGSQMHKLAGQREPRQRRSLEEVIQIIQEAKADVRAANPNDQLAEFFYSRRLLAACE